MDKEKRQELKRIFYEKIIFDLAPFEKKRKGVILSACLIGIIGTIAGILLLIFTPAKDSELPFLLIALSMTAAFYVIKQFKTSIKKAVYPTIFDVLGLKYFAKPEQLSDDLTNILNVTEVLGSFSRLHIEDLFKGEHDNLPFYMFQSRVVRGHGKHQEDIFNGIVFIAQSHKKFEKITVIKNDTGILNSLNSGQLVQVKLEDVEFEKEFEVYGQDQVEARYLLTTAFMDRLLTYSKTKQRKIKAAFYDGRIIFFISIGGDPFEVPVFDDLIKAEHYMNVTEEVYNILDIVDALKLAQNIGL